VSGPITAEPKARGAFFTPSAICDFIARWAIRSGRDRILEPSCGDAAFLTAAGKRLRDSFDLVARGAESLVSIDQVQGVELHEASAREAAFISARAGVPATILIGDFFDVSPESRFDAVIGNPPYIRYQDFTGEARAKAQRRALEVGHPMSGLASSWAPFVLHAARFVAPGGRLGLVLPAELLSVNYAAPVRSFLMGTFGQIELVLFEERVFPGVMEEVVLLLAEQPGKTTDHVAVRQLRDLVALDDGGASVSSWTPEETSDKWLPALLGPAAGETYAKLNRESFTTLSTWGNTYLGAVTGNNRFFTLTAADVSRRGFREPELLPISPPGSRHLRGTTFTERAWREMVNAGGRTHLFFPANDDLSSAARAYIKEGEALEVHKAYKCRVRKPWWRVPIVPTPDLLLTYMNHDAPRLVRNEANVAHLNSIHGVRLRSEHSSLGRHGLPIAALNSMTLLGAELVGRSYGGGMLKLEPKEADRLPVPSPDLLTRVAPALRALHPQLGRALRGGALLDAVQLVDRALLIEGAKLNRRAVRALRDAREAMFARRSARS